jgi:hypothetical protein
MRPSRAVCTCEKQLRAKRDGPCKASTFPSHRMLGMQTKCTGSAIRVLADRHGGYFPHIHRKSSLGLPFNMLVGPYTCLFLVPHASLTLGIDQPEAPWLRLGQSRSLGTKPVGGPAECTR